MSDAVMPSPGLFWTCSGQQKSLGLFLRQLIHLLALGHPGTSAAVSAVLNPRGTLVQGTLFLPLLRMCHYLYISYFSVAVIKHHEQSNLQRGLP